MVAVNAIDESGFQYLDGRTTFSCHVSAETLTWADEED